MSTLLRQIVSHIPTGLRRFARNDSPWSRTLSLSAMVGLVFLVATQPALALGIDGAQGFLQKYGSELTILLIDLPLMLGALMASWSGDLMGTSFILDGGIGHTLQLVWTVMRNFVNVAFILFMLILAARVVLDLGGDSGMAALKKVLPKMIIALVAVNLTFFGARVILTTTDVLTGVVFTLPRTIGGENLVANAPCPAVVKDAAGTIIDRPQESPEKCRAYFLGAIKNQYNAVQTGSKNGTVPKDKLVMTISKRIADTMAPSETSAWVDTRTTALALYLNLADFKNIVYTGATSGAIDWLMTNLLAIFTAIVVTVVYTALFLALIARMVMLWVYIALAPLALLVMVMKDVIPGLPDLADGGGLDDFLKYAMLPVFVGVPLSLGMIMILANNQLFDFRGVELAALGNLDDLSSLLWWIAAIAIIWGGTKKAIEKSGDLAAGMSGKVFDTAKGIGSGALGMAEHLPFLPIADAMVPIEAIKNANSMLAQSKAEESHRLGAKMAQLVNKDIEIPAMRTRGLAQAENASKAAQLLAQNGDLHVNATLDARDLAALKEVAKKEGIAEADMAFLNTPGLTAGMALEGFKSKLPARADEIESALVELRSRTSTAQQHAGLTPDQVKAATGIASEAAGKAMAAADVKDTDTKVENFMVENKQVYQAGDGTFYVRNDEADISKGGMKVMTKEELTQALNRADDVQNKDDIASKMIPAISGLKKTKDVLNSPAFANEKAGLQAALVENLKTYGVHKTMVDTLQHAWEDAFGAGSFDTMKTQLDAASADSNGFKKL